MQRNHWFANPDVPFQSVTNDLLNGQFATQMYALHQVDVTSELLHSWWFAHAQSNKKNLAKCSIFITKTGSECRQIKCYTQSHTLPIT